MADKKQRSDNNGDDEKKLRALRIVRLVHQTKREEQEKRKPELEVHDYYEEYLSTLNRSTLIEVEEPRIARSDSMYVAGHRVEFFLEFPLPQPSKPSDAPESSKVKKPGSEGSQETDDDSDEEEDHGEDGDGDDVQTDK